MGAELFICCGFIDTLWNFRFVIVVVDFFAKISFDEMDQTTYRNDMINSIIHMFA